MKWNLSLKKSKVNLGCGLNESFFGGWLKISLSTSATPEEFENPSNVFVAGEIWKRNSTIHFGFMFEENSVREITRLSWRHRFQKALFSICFPSTRNRKAGVFKFLRFEERFIKDLFSFRISVREMTSSIFTSKDVETTSLGSRMQFRMNFTSGVFSSKIPVSI